MKDPSTRGQTAATPAANSADGIQVTRRAVLRGAGGVLMTAWLPACSNSSAPAAGATAPQGFLTEQERRALRALVARLIPADADPGAAEACCDQAIDYLLGAFLSDPPFIYAGAPFSDRGGHPVNEFEAFVPLDAYEELAWRIHIEGSQGLAEREFNGPVKGLQAIYREGLAQLDSRAQAQGQADFAAAPAPIQDQIISDESDPLIAELVDVSFIDTLDAMYGPPEYGGNCDQLGWGFTAYDGDVQPRGYTAEEVVNADEPGLFDSLLPPSYHEAFVAGAKQAGAVTNPVQLRPSALAQAPSSEQISGLMNSSGGRWSRLRAQMRAARQGGNGNA